MKILSFVVPSYNSEEYMERCIESLLIGGDDVEIIIVNDGSTDGTGEIANQYKSKYPNIVKAVHQENKGHGAGVNAGVLHATGKYFKVVDSDDWLDKDALTYVLTRLREWEENDISADMLVCNYIYDHLYENKQKQVNYRNIFETEEMCGWEEIGKFMPSQYLIMHALIFNTKVLRDSGVKLPPHTFYVDNLFAYQPLPLVKKLCYFDVDLYHYFLGRDDQSVNEAVLCKRIDQQIKVTKMVFECADLNEVECSRLSDYMTRNISIMMAISSIHLLLIGTQEALDKRKELWEFIKENNNKLYRRLRFQTVSGLTYLPGAIGRFATVTGYRAFRKVYQFQ